MVVVVVSLEFLVTEFGQIPGSLFPALVLGPWVHCSSLLAAGSLLGSVNIAKLTPAKVPCITPWDLAFVTVFGIVLHW